MDRDVVARLVYSMIQFLKNELETASALSSLREEGAESVEVALQCLETAYGISQESTHLSVSKSLYDIFQEAVKDEIPRGFAPHLGSEPTTEEKAEAERLKNEGNQLMREEKFDKALDCYTKAIGKDRTNAVYYCNRAAAHSKLNNHLEAIEDCKRALRIEPQYSKAYGRMGLAYSYLDKAEEAKECYQKALEVEPDNESYKGNLQIAEKLQSQQTQQSSSGTSNSNPFTSLGGGFNLGALGNLAGLASGGGSGTPDIQGLFSNPTLMNMATQIMSDPNMQNIQHSFNLPLPHTHRMASFLGNVSGGGGQPTPASTQSTPTNGTEGGSPGGPAGMEALLTAGRQLAEQMQAHHPELVEQLRTQMNRAAGGPSQGENENEGNEDPPEPPQA